MALDLLDTPVRITWDIPAADVTPASNLPAIAAAIADGGAFFVTLQGQPLLHPELRQVLDVLAGSCQVMVECRGGAGELERLELIARSGGRVLLDTAGFIEPVAGVDAGRLKAVVTALRQAGCEPSLTLTPLRSNLLFVPQLLQFCSENGLPKFKLPNAHIGDSFQQYSSDELPRWQDLELFRQAWEVFSTTAPKLPAMEIHDLFLWEIMIPGQAQGRSEYGGCQAGNSLGHVDYLGVVHPCAAWPQPLGRLPEQDLADIWASPGRLAVREKIAGAPPGCVGCRDLETCFGGCRGLSSHLNSSAGERDLMCSGRR